MGASRSGSHRTGLLAMLLLLAAGRAAALDVRIDAPLPTSSSRDPVFVCASVTSELQVQSVTARVGEHQVELAPGQRCTGSPWLPPQPGGWGGLVPVPDLSRGPQTLTVTATDVFGATAATQQPFFLDRAPSSVTFSAPSPEQVARPNLPVKIDCVDDDPAGCTVQVVLQNTGHVILTATTPLDTTLSLAPFDGSAQPLGLAFSVFDSAGNFGASVSSWHDQDSSPLIIDVLTARGVILDVSADRVLALGGYNAPSSVELVELATGVSTLLPEVPGLTPREGFLTAHGAIFRAEGDASSLDSRIFEWRDGALVEVSSPDTASSELTVAGDHAVWSEYLLGPPYSTSLLHRDLASAATVVVAPGSASAHPSIGAGAVAPNGDVVYSVYDSTQQTSNIVRWRAGVSTPLTSDAAATWNTSPATDGSLVVFSRQNRQAMTTDVVLLGPDGVTTLATNVWPSPSAPLAGGYLVKDGRVAFARQAPDRSMQIWTRSPSGVLEQQTFWSEDSWPESVGPGVRLTFLHDRGRYVLPAGGQARRISSPIGQASWLSDVGIVVAGSSLFSMAGTGCLPTWKTLCLGGRFQVRVDWRNPYDGGTTGTGQAVPITGDTGAFWFFQPSNLELILKVLDGTRVNGEFWVLFGALSDVGYTVTVTDTETGAAKTYTNPPYNLASVADVEAFPATAGRQSVAPAGGSVLEGPANAAIPPAVMPERSTALAAPCATGGPDLCLNGDRFRVNVAWKSYTDGTEGSGVAQALTSDTGAFWFFWSTNLELVIKVLDGTGVNGRFWVLYGALSDVEYSITITDTETGAVKTYVNPPHHLASVADVEAF